MLQTHIAGVYVQSRANSVYVDQCESVHVSAKTHISWRVPLKIRSARAQHRRGLLCWGRSVLWLLFACLFDGKFLWWEVPLVEVSQLPPGACLDLTVLYAAVTSWVGAWDVSVCQSVLVLSVFLTGCAVCVD
jgi:hypothetical protein